MSRPYILDLSLQSNAALLTMAWFMTIITHEDYNLRERLLLELDSRGILTNNFIHVNKLEDDDLAVFHCIFHEPGGSTLEDEFVKATLGIDRFKIRKACGFDYPECES